MINQTLRNANIMIVDDAIANLDVLEGFCRKEGYKNIITVNDPRNVLPLAGTFNPDLILLDLLMPHLSGYEVMEQLKQVISPEVYLPILVLTADITNEAKERALSGGAKDFLTKPLNLVEVGLRMRNLLETRFLYHQLENQNLVLEKKVKERTIELEEKNRQLEIAKDEAIASDRLKTAFLQSISHEIRTPLNGILGFGELLVDPDIVEDDKETFLQLLKTSSNRLMKTINDYLDMSMVVSGNVTIFPKNVNISALIDEIRIQYNELCDEKGVNLLIEIPANIDDTIIKTDQDMLRKILLHLMDNAVKFTQSGHIKLGIEKNSDTIGFYVLDTGIGIEKDLQDQVFKIFMQAEMGNTRRYEGSGLGLSLVKALVQLLGGTLSFVSEPGKGSRFTFSLPLKPAETLQFPKPASAPGFQNNQHPVILIVEDEKENYVFLRAVLSKYASKILLATNGKIAVDMCREHPEISLVLMDIKMPEMDGINATQIIKSFRKELPVIALTAYAIDGDERQAIEAGCDDYLLKPFNRLALHKLLQKHGFIV